MQNGKHIRNRNLSEYMNWYEKKEIDLSNGVNFEVITRETSGSLEKKVLLYYG